MLRHILGLNERFQGIMTYAAAETAYLANQGFDDLLLAYPPPRLIDLDCLVPFWKAGKKIVIMQDDSERIKELDHFAASNGIQIAVCVDLDLSVDFPGLHFGVWRSPINRMPKLDVFLKVLKSCSNLRLAALMGYEAQIAGLGDQMPGQGLKNWIIRLLKKRALPLLRARRTAALQRIREAGFTLDYVNGGGTGSLETTSEEAGVTELTAGSGFFQSHLFDYYSGFTHRPAAGFALGISRIPKPGVFTCHMGGYIASGGVGAEKLPKVWLPEGAVLDKNEGAGEVQTPVFYTGPEQLRIGDPVFFRHAKAGELCAHFDTLHIIRAGVLSGTVSTYKSELKC